MLKVNAGVCGRVRIVKQNSITGEITGEFEFDNIWTDFGINRISTYATQLAYWPSYIHWGSGVRAEPHNSVTSLAAPIGYGYSVFGSGSSSVVTEGNLCTVTKTRSATQNARGVAWELSELGLSSGISSGLDTYALVRDLNGDPSPIPVSAIEIITIYYTIQAQYPISLPPQSVDVEGLPPTTATFLLRPDRSGFGNGGMASLGDSSSSSRLSGYTTSEFGGSVTSSHDGIENVWGINDMNRTTEYFGSPWGISHIWTLDPPITKDNTQELRLEIFWQFANATPVE